MCGEQVATAADDSGSLNHVTSGGRQVQRAVHVACLTNVLHASANPFAKRSESQP